MDAKSAVLVAVDSALEPPEYKYEYGENKWQKVIDSEIIDEKMYFLTDRERWTGFVLEYDNHSSYPTTYKLNGTLDDDERATDILEELHHSVMVKRIKSNDCFVADTLWMKEDNSPDEWELYNEIEGWEALHEVEAYIEKLGEAAVEQWESFDGGLKVLDKVRNENVLYLTTSIEGEGGDAVKRGYAIENMTDDNGVETMTAYKYHENGVAILLDRMHGAELVAYEHPTNDSNFDGEVKLYMVADDKLEAELRKSNRELAVEYYEHHFESESEDPPGHYAGGNWNERNEGPTTPATEERLINDECLVCFEKFKEKEKVSKWRCGHCFCLGCAADMKKRRWKRCTTCRKSKTAREVEYTTP
jgi:hypothetical protein